MGNNQEQKKNRLEKVIDDLTDQAKNLQDIIEIVKEEDPEAEFPKGEDGSQEQGK